MFLSSLLSYFYKDGITADLFLSGVLVSIIGLLMLFLNKSHDKQINKREGYLVVVLGWVAMIFSGTIPYILTGTIDGFSNIFFETTSGYTATGATIINDVEVLPEGILFWRSITHWLGGMGMIVFAIAILPLLGIGGMQLFNAESPGPSTDKLHPRITDTAKRLWLIYVSYTIIETIFLKIAGMSFFDAINHSMSNIASPLLCPTASMNQSSKVIFSLLLSKITTSAPRFLNSFAVAKPIAPDPPVITTTFPSNSFEILFLSLACSNDQYSILKAALLDIGW